MENIYCTLLISPPGGGKSTWLANHQYDLLFDDMSVLPAGIKDFTEQIKANQHIAIADINFCDYEILKKAWHKLSQIAQAKGLEIEFKHVLFIGEKDQYFKNVEARNDGRNVKASIERFYPHIQKLVDIDIGPKEVINIHSYKVLANKSKPS
jgi:hypothetical protein